MNERRQQKWFWTLGVLAAVLLALVTDRFGVVSIALGALTLIGVLFVHTTLRWPLLVVLLLTFLLPFERIPSLDVAGVTLRINHLVSVVGIAVLALKLLVDRLPARPYPAAPWLMAFMATALLGVSQSVSVEQGTKTFVFTLFTMVISAVVVQFVRSTDDLKQVIKWLMPSATIVVLFALYQTLGDIVGLPLELTGLNQGYTKVVLGFPRPQAFSIEPLYLANYLFLPLGVFGALWLGKIGVSGEQLAASSADKKPAHRSPLTAHSTTHGLLILGILLVIALTISRGAWLALIPFTAVIALTLMNRFFTVRALGTLAVAALVILAATVGFLSVSREDALSQFVEHAQIGDLQQGESTQGRLIAFKEAVRAWEGSPVFGIGMGNFGSFVKGYPDPREIPVTDIVNNEYLELLSETGLIGFALMASFVLAIFARQVVALSHSREPLHRAVLIGTLAAFVATLAQYTFFSTLYVIHIWVLIGLMIAVQNLVLVGDDVRRTNHGGMYDGLAPNIGGSGTDVPGSLRDCGNSDHTV